MGKKIKTDLYDFNDATWQYGKEYYSAMGGLILSKREYGVKLGSVRLFSDITYSSGQALYYAERKFTSMIPLRAPKIWWKKLDLGTTERAIELEKFVSKLAKIENYEGWQGEYFKEARELCMKGFVNKLKGKKDESGPF